MPADMTSFFSNKCVFITGGTGFLGTLLIEKLLYSCNTIEKIYVLVRPKGATDCQERLKQLLSSTAFSRLRQKSEDHLRKIVPVYGDLSDSRLDIQDSEILQQMRKRISVVFHMAANVKFTEDLKKAVDCNVLGTLNVMKFCRELTKLEVVLHVSTAYANCDKDKVNERIYSFSVDVRQFIKDLPEDADYVQLTSSFTKLPNSYNLSKAFAEHLINEEFQDLPVVIVRPAVVVAAVREPEPGWSASSLGSPSSLIAALAKGLLHTMKADDEIVIDIVPADYVINACIAAAWDRCIHRLGKITVYHVGTSHLNPLTLKEFMKHIQKAVYKDPPKDLVWYPTYALRKSNLLYNLEAYIYHHLPARVMDFFMGLKNKKPFVVRLYGKIEQLKQVLAFYFMKDLVFYADNLVELYQSLDEQDRKNFDFDIRKLNWPFYLDIFYRGVRTHILKDDPSTIPAARIELQGMRRMHQLMTFVALCGLPLILLLLFYSFSTMMSQSLTP